MAGSKQEDAQMVGHKEYMTKSESSWPIVLLKARCSYMLKTQKKKWYVTVTDKSGEFLHADMNKEVHMQL